MKSLKRFAIGVLILLGLLFGAFIYDIGHSQRPDQSTGESAKFPSHYKPIGEDYNGYILHIGDMVCDRLTGEVGMISEVTSFIKLDGCPIPNSDGYVTIRLRPNDDHSYTRTNSRHCRELSLIRNYQPPIEYQPPLDAPRNVQESTEPIFEETIIVPQRKQ